MSKAHLAVNADSLSQLLDEQLAKVIGTIKDPDAIDTIERNTDKLALATIALVGATGDALEAAKLQMAEATAVLTSYASAEIESAAAAVRNVIGDAIKFALRAAETAAFGVLTAA